MSDNLSRLYHELAPWYYLLTAREEYAEEAPFYEQVMREASSSAPRTLLELGCGGGNIASYFKERLDCTLTDSSPEMLSLSSSLNPECEHVQGDMRTLRLGRQFDLVFVHDAVVYMTSEADLRQAIETAFVHCRPGGIALFAPDHVRDTFAESVDHGGHDGDTRGLRYLEWTTDPDPTDTTYKVDYAFLLHEAGKPDRAAYDQHIEGLFSVADWLRLLVEAGFRARTVPAPLADTTPGHLIFVAERPG